MPAYTPYIVADVTAVPWPVGTAEHTAALAGWRAGKEKKKKALRPQSLPLNAWALYRMRFIFTADIRGAWSTFGGIAAQFNHLSIVLHLATVENIPSALLYDSVLSAHLEELDMARAEKSSESVDFAQLLSVEQTRFNLQAVTQAAKPSQPVKER